VSAGTGRWGAVALALWFASATSLVVSQFGERLEPQALHPEIPADDPREIDSLLEGCDTLLGRKDVLTVVYLETDVQHVFAAYRLAYLLYPTLVDSEPYGGASGNDADSAVSKALDGRPSHVLVLGTAEMPAGHAALVARFGPNARLYRVTHS